MKSDKSAGVSTIRRCPAGGTGRSVACTHPVRRHRARSSRSAARREQSHPLLQLAAGGSRRGRRTCPTGALARPDRQVFLNQYVVDDETQTSGFGAYSLTYLGVSLLSVDAPGGLNPGGWWTTTWPPVDESGSTLPRAVLRCWPAGPGSG
ncbi:hypothetical protein NKG94_19380 [Micromonospora sp. M12]